jgi:Bacteriophage T4-like portal protein (Gp20)
MANLYEQVSSFFGFEIKRPQEQKQEQIPSFAPKQDDDGAAIISTGGFYGTYVDLEGTVKTEAELVNKYRDMSLHPEVDSALEDIVDEAIVCEEGEKTVAIVLDDLETLPKNIKTAIEKEFEEVLRLLEFNTKAYEIFRRWYIDGRLYYHVMVDETAPNEGIKELRYLDPRRIRKIRETTKTRDKRMPNVPIQKIVNEYYLYTDKDMALSGNKSITTQSSAVGIKIAKDSIVHCTSSIVDNDGKMVLGFLHKAIKPLNQLRAMEDAVVIYRISRAPERRVFYIDVGNLPKIKAEQYIRDMMVKHRNKLVYDQSTGEIRDDRKFMTMLEDYWLPRREGNKGTEIDTLAGGQSLGVLDDVQYFQRKLYKSLNVPMNRLEPEETYAIGRATEISRDEIKFAKFIDRLRLKFSGMFLQMLEKQLVLKMIITPDEWHEIQSEIKFRYLRDNCFSELKDQEILMGRMTVLQQISLYVGRYYSNSWVRRNILKQTDEEMEQIDSEIAQESLNPQYQTPIDAMDSFDQFGMGPSGTPPPGPSGGGNGPKGPSAPQSLNSKPNKKPTLQE